MKICFISSREDLIMKSSTSQVNLFQNNESKIKKELTSVWKWMKDQWSLLVATDLSLLLFFINQLLHRTVSRIRSSLGS